MKIETKAIQRLFLLILIIPLKSSNVLNFTSPILSYSKHISSSFFIVEFIFIKIFEINLLLAVFMSEIQYYVEKQYLI